MRIIKNTDSNFPKSFVNLKDTPDQVFLSKDWDFSRPSIAVVGARNMKPWVPQWLDQEFLPFIKKYDLAVISGGARGVDQAAHAVALRAGCPTLAFLPSGLSCVYPRTLTRFHQHPQFVMATEYLQETEMRKHHFYHRNRLIASLCSLIFVIQAEKKSGSMITARLAIENGATVLTLPGHVLEPEFSGNNQLLYDGALMIRNFADLETLYQSETFLPF
jgi:DNA processing protein